MHACAFVLSVENAAPMSHHSPPPRTWAEIDPSALVHNVQAIRSHVGAKVSVMAVVKANAYGHGVNLVVPAVAEHVEWLGVANLTEAIEVRELIDDHPILLLGPAAPDERAEIVARGFVPMVSNAEEAAAYSQLSRTARAPIHVKLDTGMGRMGIWHEDAVSTVREIRSLHGVQIAGIASHLPVADEDDDFTRTQLALFHRTVETLREEVGIGRTKVHVCNSAGAIGFPDECGDFVRLGLALYGISPRPEFQAKLRPALVWKTRITLVRDVPAGCSVSYGRTFVTTHKTRIATLAVGYADGYQRHLSNHDAQVVIHGQRCPVLGRVTMDQILVDVSHLEGCVTGDVAELVGESLLASELARRAGTIPWEIFTGIGQRVVRLQKGR